MVTPTLPIAFVAGLLSFLSPCVLPLVPSYLAYVGGSVGGSGGAGDGRRLLVLRNSLFFVLGFSLVFVALGASASALGSLLLDYRYTLITVAGVLIVFFGLMMLGLFKLPIFYREFRFRFRGDAATPLGATLLGTAFGVGWTPCIGPVLGAILTLAGATGTLSQGVTLLAVYALGLAVPFLLAALAVGSFGRFYERFRHYLPWVERAAGSLLVVVGVMMLSGYYTWLNSYFIRFTPSWLWPYL
jgi:cytochrome c-type biogenesis protein